MQALNDLTLPSLFETLTGGGPLDRLLDAARHEDLDGAGDVTTAAMIYHGRTVRADGTAREAGVVCGMPLLGPVLAAFESQAAVETRYDDGARCTAGDVLWCLRGELGPILTAERTLLNLFGRLSGVATLTARYVELAAGTGAAICDTRKTTPGLRALEKYAVRCGGGTLHRLGLYDAMLLKDNHLAHLGPDELGAEVIRAATAARSVHDLRFVEVEVATLDQLQTLLQWFISEQVEEEEAAREIIDNLRLIGDSGDRAAGAGRGRPTPGPGRRSSRPGRPLP